MSRAKCSEEQYIQFLIASPLSTTTTEAARVDPREGVAHDAYRRLLLHLEPSADELWKESSTLIGESSGVLVIDDSTLEKPHARNMALVGFHWSGNQHRVVRGISLVTLLWTDGDTHIPCDYRVRDPEDKSVTKNDLFEQMIRMAHQRQMRPEMVCFDGWYSRLENLKLIRDLGWKWLTRLKTNRMVSMTKGAQIEIGKVDFGGQASIVTHLRGYGAIRVFRIIHRDASVEHWATNDLQMGELDRIAYADKSWKIEEYHRGIKQFCGVEKCQARLRTIQLNHIGCSLRAFLRMSQFCLKAGVSWHEFKHQLQRSAARLYLSRPTCQLV